MFNAVFEEFNSYLSSEFFLGCAEFFCLEVTSVISKTGTESVVKGRVTLIFAEVENIIDEFDSVVKMMR